MERAALDVSPPYVVSPADSMARIKVLLEPFPADRAAEFGAVFAEMTPWSDYGYSPERLAAYFAGGKSGAVPMLVTADGSAAGIAGIRSQWLRGPFLQFLGILPEFQGRGIGRAVLSWWERQALAAGDRNLWVTVSEFNARARTFYGRYGFVETANLPGLIDERCEILLRKRL